MHDPNTLHSMSGNSQPPLAPCRYTLTNTSHGRSGWHDPVSEDDCPLQTGGAIHFNVSELECSLQLLRQVVFDFNVFVGVYTSASPMESEPCGSHS